VSSRSDFFQCRWRASRWLLTAYLGAQCLALFSLFWLDIPPRALVLGVFVCLLHGAYMLARAIIFSSPQAFTGLRRDRDGWQLWNAEQGWRPVQLRRDSLALPLLIVLRFRLAGRGRVRSVCIPADALAPDDHRRLRLRLKFSRRRWAAPE
jgi:toxin CptA